MNNLREIRKKKGVSLTEAANAIGIWKQRLSQLERESTCWKEPLMRKIAIYYGMNIFEMLKEDALKFKPRTEEERTSLLHVVENMEIKGK